jgi:ethylbenzene dioxygenase ferredoxin component
MRDEISDKMPDNVTNNIVRICTQSEIAPDGVKAFEVGDRRLAVFNIGGRFYVTDDECTHASASLADGMLDGEVIECAMHLGAFHVPTGEVKAPPCAVALRTYKVIREGDDVLVDLDRDAAGELA